MSKVGKLDTLGLAVYERADGPFFYHDDDVHGNQKWTRTNGRAMRGQHRGTGAKTAAKTTGLAAKSTSKGGMGGMGGMGKMPDHVAWAIATWESYCLEHGLE